MEKQERGLAATAQLSFLLGFIIVPLVIWLISDNQFVRRHSKQALINQIVQTLGVAVCVIITLGSLGMFLLPFSTGTIIGWPLFVALVWTCYGAAWLVLFAFSVAGAVRAAQGREFVYPLSGKTGGARKQIGVAIILVVVLGFVLVCTHSFFTNGHGPAVDSSLVSSDKHKLFIGSSEANEPDSWNVSFRAFIGTYLVPMKFASGENRQTLELNYQSELKGEPVRLAVVDENNKVVAEIPVNKTGTLRINNAGNKNLFLRMESADRPEIDTMDVLKAMSHMMDESAIGKISIVWHGQN